MAGDASELARRLSCEAEAVCRHYLSNGRRAGRYWLVGDVYNTPGRSLFVRHMEKPPSKWMSLIQRSRVAPGLGGAY